MEPLEADYFPWQADLLVRALKLRREQRLPHALMIDTSSDRDIGAFAQYLSLLLLCENPDELRPCDACSACRMMRAGTYADYRLVTLLPDEKTKKISKNIKIEQIRDLIHEVSLTQSFGALKIAAIYPAELMSNAGANALLKTLEEPSSSVLLLLLTHNRGRIPITLRSRCQSWTITPPGRVQALEWLQQQGVSGQDAERYLDYAGGDPVLAFELQKNDYGALVEGFKSRFTRFLRGDLSASRLCRELASNDISMLRRLVAMTLNAYCYQSSGVDGEAKPLPQKNRQRAQRLLDLRQRAQNQLRVEENNLDFQLQLEDVLISLKQILTRRFT